MERTRLVPGLILIALGVLFLAAQRTGFGAEAVVAAIGVVFLVTFAVTRQYGFLVPGGILTGLGIGIIFETRTVDGGAPILLGLGLGFASIYAIDRLVHRMSWGWWPLIPGGILTFIGLLLAAGQAGILGQIGRWWPALLILLGVFLLFRGRGIRRFPEP